MRINETFEVILINCSNRKIILKRGIKPQVLLRTKTKNYSFSKSYPIGAQERKALWYKSSTPRSSS
jgi:hypothetical protein